MWCKIRDDGSKCIDCEIKDQEVEISSQQHDISYRRKAYEAEEELQISDIENEIAQSEMQSKLFSDSKFISKDHEP